jgi:hypothetical protein
MAGDGREPLRQRPKRLRMGEAWAWTQLPGVWPWLFRFATERIKERPTELYIPGPSNNPSRPPIPPRRVRVPAPL